MKEQLKEYLAELNTPNLEIPRLSVKWRVILIPIMFIWFLMQLWVFSIFMGTFAIIFGSMFLCAQPFMKPSERDWGFSLWVVLIPFFGPFIWIYRYSKFGEYNPFLKT